MNTNSQGNFYLSNLPPQRNRISDDEYQEATNKLLYEINLRRNEFIGLCQAENKDFSTKLLSSKFKKIVNAFTIYLSDYEINLIINKYANEDNYIDFDFISNLHPKYNIKYKDEFLQHLNRLHNKINVHDVYASTAKIGQVFDLSPIEKVNCEINEENFMTKVAKRIMNDILIKATQITPFEYMRDLFNKCDFDHDDRFTIGEVSKFLSLCDIALDDSDLKFFFEKFPLLNGRVSLNVFQQYISSSSQKNLNKTAKTEFVSNDVNELVQVEEDKDERNYNEIMRENYIVNVVKECIMIFGKNFLLRYFSKYLEFQNNQFFIDDNYLEIGLNSLGYKQPSKIDEGKFKMLCINKHLGEVKENMCVRINLENLFEYIIDFFRMSKIIKEFSSDEIVKRISLGLINKMNDSFLLSVSDRLAGGKFNSNINEFEFRKKFIQTFGFIDHNFFDLYVSQFKIQGGDFWLKNDFKLNEFKLQKIDSQKFLNFAYNISFIGMVRNYLNLGLMLDNQDVNALIQITNKIQRKLFPHIPPNEVEAYKKINIETIGRALPKKLISPNINMMEEKGAEQSESSQPIKLKEFVLGGVKDKGVTFKNNDVEITNGQRQKIQIGRGVAPKKKKVDTVTTIPKLFDLCKNYIVSKYKVDNVNYDVLANIGICRIFRDDLIRQGVDIKKKIYAIFLINNLDHLLKEEDIKDFINEIVMTNRDTDGNISIQFFFLKIEEILLQYCKYIYNKS